MTKNIARTSVGLLALLVAATGCALPASPTKTAVSTSTQVATIAVEATQPADGETATAAPLPIATEPAVAAIVAAESTPLVVKMPEKETPVVEPQPADGIVEPTDEQQWVLDGLPGLGEAPELRNDVWLNSEPLRLAGLRGQVVLLDMWTFG